jgi:hypothetical protein
MEEEERIRRAFGQPTTPLKLPIQYAGADVNLSLKIFVRDQVPIDIAIRFSKQEIEQLAAKDFVPA